MPHDPELVAETRAWLLKARLDLAAADHAFAAVSPLLEDAVFHAQQAAEKTLKAFLAWHQNAFRKTHNIEELGEQCLALDGGLKELIDRAVPLTEYAWRFRYPGEPTSPGPDEARDALTTAQEVHKAILARLPAEARP
jgi:HEPN domain-containing protein